MKRTPAALAAADACGSRRSRCSAGSCSGSWSSAPTCGCSCRVPTTPEQRLLLEEIGEGPASRVLVVALEGADARVLADVSRALVDSSAAEPELPRRHQRRGVARRRARRAAAVPLSCSRRRSIRSARRSSTCTRELLARARDLASPAGAFLEPWLPRDPTLELLKLLQRWQPMQEPQREFDVWFDRDGRRALLLAETQAPAFDPDRQRARARASWSKRSTQVARRRASDA